MIEPVSDLRLQTFGNIAGSVRRFSPEYSEAPVIQESRDRAHNRKAPATARILAIQTDQTERPDWLAGAGGFEPPNGGIKIRCLTTWLRPNFAQFAALSAAVQCFAMKRWLEAIKVAC